MFRKSLLTLMALALIMPSCQKKETAAEEFKITGNIMEVYYPDKSLQAKGPVIIEEQNGKKVNLKDGDWTFFHKDSKGKAVAAKGKFVKDKRDGVWQIFYPKGQLKTETTYENGALNGVTKNYNLEGKLESEVYYVNNKVAGKKTTYYKSGAKEKEETFIDGKRNGKSTTWYENGTIQKLANYDDDKLNGQYTEFYPDGKKKMEGRYVPIPQAKIDENPNLAAKEGDKIGTWVLYHKTGNKFLTGEYVDGKMSGKWLQYTEDGTLEAEGMYSENTKDGIWRYYNSKKQLEKEYFFVKDMVNGVCRIYENGRLTGEGEMNGLPKGPKKQGTWKQFYANGKVEFEGIYQMDKKNGKFREYHPNGKLKAEGEYMNNKRNGVWTFYKEDGVTKDEELSGMYMMDKLNKKLGK